jgi:hypothetical protein
MYFSDIGCEYVNLVLHAQDRVQYQFILNLPTS